MGQSIAKMAVAALLCSAMPAHAETAAQLDALSRSAQQPGTGLALARRQIRDGDLLGAMATLERVAINAPDNREARLLHAGLLCRLDDRQGSLIEFDNLRGSDFSDALWEEATGACEQPREEASKP